MIYFSFTAEHLPDYELVISFLFGVLCNNIINFSIFYVLNYIFYFLVLIPGLYHTFIIINIWLGT